MHSTPFLSVLSKHRVARATRQRYVSVAKLCDLHRGLGLGQPAERLQTASLLFSLLQLVQRRIVSGEVLAENEIAW